MILGIIEGISATKLAIVLLIILVIFGPARLPQLGRQLGSAMREFKNSITGRGKDDYEWDEEMPQESPNRQPELSTSTTTRTASSAAPNSGTSYPQEVDDSIDRSGSTGSESSPAGSFGQIPTEADDAVIVASAKTKTDPHNPSSTNQSELNPRPTTEDASREQNKNDGS